MPGWLPPPPRDARAPVPLLDPHPYCRALLFRVLCSGESATVGYGPAAPPAGVSPPACPPARVPPGLFSQSVFEIVIPARRGHPQRFPDLVVAVASRRWGPAGTPPGNLRARRTPRPPRASSVSGAATRAKAVIGRPSPSCYGVFRKASFDQGAGQPAFEKYALKVQATGTGAMPGTDTQLVEPLPQ